MSKDKNLVTRALDLIQASHDQTDMNKIVGQPITRGDETVIPLGHFIYGFNFALSGDAEDDKERADGQADIAHRNEELPPGIRLFRPRGGKVGSGVWTAPAAVIRINKDGVEVNPVIGPFVVALIAICAMVAGIAWARAFRIKWSGSTPAKTIPANAPTAIRLTPDSE